MAYIANFIECIPDDTDSFYIACIFILVLDRTMLCEEWVLSISNFQVAVYDTEGGVVYVVRSANVDCWRGFESRLRGGQRARGCRGCGWQVKREEESVKPYGYIARECQEDIRQVGIIESCRSISSIWHLGPTLSLLVPNLPTIYFNASKF